MFLGTEHFFQQIRGVVGTEVGYANGNTQNPTYEEVVSHTTGFAETVKVKYDPEQVDLKLLIDLYFKTIDPTSKDQQGNDRGNQYRTGIYFTDKTDEAVVKGEVQKLAKITANLYWWKPFLLKISIKRKIITRIIWIKIREDTAILNRDCLKWPKSQSASGKNNLLSKAG